MTHTLLLFLALENAPGLPTLVKSRRLPSGWSEGDWTYS
jgi:hypothetical protein